MAKKSYDIAFRLGAKLDGTYGGAFKSAEDVASKTAAKVTKIAAAIGGAILSAAAVKDAVDVYRGFEQSMANTAAIAGVEKSTKEYARLEKAALDAGKATSKTAQESADALGYMALAGWSADESIKGLMPVLRLSEATGADLAHTSDLVTDSMASLGLKVDDLTHFLDVAAVANNKSNQTATHLLEAYIGVGGVFKNFNTDITESAALLGVLANRGIKGSEAGHKMSSVLINMTKKSGESADALAELGINAYDAEGRFKGVSVVLAELNEKTRDLTEKQRNTYLQMIGGKTQLDTLNALMSGLNTLNAEGVNELQALQVELSHSEGALDKMADAINATMTGALFRLSSAADVLKIKLVKQFAPYITSAIDGIAAKLPALTEKLAVFLSKLSGSFSKLWNTGKGFFTWVSNNPDTIAKFFITIGTAIMAHKVAAGITGVAAATKALFLVFTANPIGIALMAAAGAFAFFATTAAQTSARLKQENLAERFGSISMSMEELDGVAKSIVRTSNLERIEQSLESFSKLDGLQASMAAAVSELDKYNWKVSVGIALTEDDNESYKQAVASYIKNAQKLLDEKQYALNISMEVLTSDTEQGQAIRDSVNQFYEQHRGTLEGLGIQLQDTVNAAFEDGFLDIDEQRAISELQGKMAAIIAALAKSQYEAKLEVLGMSFDGVALDGESFKELQTQMSEEVEATSASYKEALILSIANAKVMLDEGAIDRSQYDTMVEEVKRNYLQDVGELELTAFNFQYDTIQKSHGGELEAAAKDFADFYVENVDTYLTNALSRYSKGEGIGQLEDAMYVFESAMLSFDGLDRYSAANVRDLYNNMKPDIAGMEQLKAELEAAADLDDAGRKMLDSTNAGLLDAYTMGAMAGDVDALYKLIGTSVGEDNNEYQAILWTLENQGNAIPEKLAAGIEAQYPVAESAASGLASAFLGKLESSLSKEVSARIALNVSLSSTLIPDALNSHSAPLPKFATGSEYTPGAFIAGERGPELITNAEGSKVFTAAETGGILENMARYKNLWTDDGTNDGARRVSADRILAQPPAIGETGVEIHYAPQIVVEGGESGGVENVIKRLLLEHKGELERLVMDVLAGDRMRRERLSNG